VLPDPLDLRSVRDPELIRLGEIVGTLRDIAPEEQLLLIGAQVRNLLLGWGLGIAIGRATRDVDFAIGVDDWGHFLGLRERMLASGRFHTSQTLHRLRFEHPAGTIVDVVPFGGVEDEDRSIAWPPEYAITMSAVGFQEAFVHSAIVALPGDVPVKVASLAAFAVLKLFAWMERERDTRGKDATDLGQVLDHYDRAIGIEQLYEVPDTVLEGTGGDNTLMAAWRLGRDMGEVLIPGDGTRSRAQPETTPMARLVRLLRRETDQEGPTQLAVDMGPARLVRSLEQLEWLRKGLEADTSMLER
jgi:predicted nucleotidyltransferase